MIFYFSITFFVFGLIFGSFLNVCIYRLPRKKSVVWPSSFCPECQSPIKPLDNIPLISYLLLRGQCRNCHTKISWRYPLVEVLTGVLFGGLFLKFGFSQEIIALLILAVLLVVITFIDIEFKLILNVITIPGIVIGGILSWHLGSMDLIQIGLGLLIGGGLLIGIALFGKKLFGKDSMGMGDIKMAAMIGVFIGAKGIALAIFLSFLIAGIFSFIGLSLKKIKRTSYIPFGPFIAAGTVVYIFFGEQIINWYLTFSGLK